MHVFRDHKFSNKNSRNKVYRKAAKKWGIFNQLVKAVEELAELSVELAKLFNKQRDMKNQYDKFKVIDELADARIMIEQTELNFGLRILVKDRIVEKVTKLEQLLEGEK